MPLPHSDISEDMKIIKNVKKEKGLFAKIGIKKGWLFLLGGKAAFLGSSDVSLLAGYHWLSPHALPNTRKKNFKNR